MSELKSASLVEHLMDLKKCLVNALWIIMIGFAVSLFFSSQLFDFIRAPIAPYLPAGGLVFTAPVDKFAAYLKVSFLASVVVTCPLWLYQVWLFIAPGLYKNERKLAVYFIAFGTFLFCAGVTFVYTLVFPMAFKYLLTFGGSVDKPMITISEYLGFFVTTTLLFGAVFELPLILVILGMVGVIDASFLRTKRRLAYMLLAVLSAVVTPPDALSMLAMLGPLILLYELSIVLVVYLGKKRELELKT